MPKYLIVNADDFGMSPGVSRGILEAHAAGVVTSTTALVNTDWAEESLSWAVARAPRLGLGLHINLSFGYPVLAPKLVPSLVGPDGRFFSGNRLLQAMKHFRKLDIRREVGVQFERCVALAGRTPDHLDSHQFVGGLHPEVFAAMLELAATEHIPLRNPGDFLDRERLDRLLLRIARENDGRGPAPGDFRSLPETLSTLRRSLPPFRAPDALRYEFYGGGARREVVVDIFDSLSEGVTELMCHPGYADGLEDSYRLPREAELAILRDPLLHAAARDRGVELVSFAVLGTS
jgi:chitin disaccharide deacetylase